MEEKPKGGRPKKSSTQKTIRIEDDLLQWAEGRAESLGLDFTNYVKLLIAKDRNTQ
jgi:antitoxin component of RelBE/YafQ-DinJ toxin-antitoxin module